MFGSVRGIENVVLELENGAVFWRQEILLDKDMTVFFFKITDPHSIG